MTASWLYLWHNRIELQPVQGEYEARQATHLLAPTSHLLFNRETGGLVLFSSGIPLAITCLSTRESRIFTLFCLFLPQKYVPEAALAAVIAGGEPEKIYRQFIWPEENVFPVVATTLDIATKRLLSRALSQLHKKLDSTHINIRCLISIGYFLCSTNDGSSDYERNENPTPMSGGTIIPFSHKKIP